jgi:hypothetical protein
MFKNAFTFALGAVAGIAIYKLVTKAATVVVETVVDTVAS